MMNKTDTQSFNPLSFIDGLIEEMNMQNDDEAKLKWLKDAMLKALTRQVFQAATENIEPAVIDTVMEELKDEEDAVIIIQTLLRSSPGAQAAMLEALDEFRDNTLEAFNKLKA